MSVVAAHRPAIAGKLALEEVTTIEELESLRPEWTALWSHARGVTPFQTPQWLIPWWRHMGAGRLLVLALRHGGRLVGVVPWFIRLDAQNNTPTVMLLGAGASDYLDAIFAPGFEQAGVVASLEWLDENRKHWQTIEYVQLRAGSPLLATPPLHGWSDSVAPGEPCPVLRLPPSSPVLEQALPAGQIANLRYYTSRARKAGALAFEQATPANVESLLERLIQLHRRRWHGLGRPGIFCDPAVERFHRSAAATLLSLGVLRLYALRLGGQVVAVYYGFSAAGRAYYYIGGFDPDWSAISPGTLLVGYAIEQAILEHAQEFDFLRGRERYKYLWGASDRATYRRTLRKLE